MPPYKIAKLLVPRMNFITSNEFTVKGPFCFAKEIVEQGSSLVMGRWDVDSSFPNIPLNETVDICTNTIYSEQDVIEGRHQQRRISKSFIISYKRILFYFQRGFT